jgi:chromosome segregation ATPase
MKIIAAALSIIACFSSLAFAEDFKTIDGKEYKDVTVRRVEPDGIVVTTKSGIAKLYFAELPTEVQTRFLGDHASEQELQARLAALQQHEQLLLKQIGEANEAKIHKKRRRAKYLNDMNYMTAQLPALRKEVADVRASMKDVKAQLDAMNILRARQAPPENASPQQAQPR